MPPMFTVRQGEYLSFIHSYTTKVGVSPSFADIARHFGTALPNVNGMIKTLERRGLLSRTPGVARSLRVLVPAELLPRSQFGSRASRARTPVVSTYVVQAPPVSEGTRSSSSVADAAVATALATLEVVMPHLPSATRRSSGSTIVIEVARAIREALVGLGVEAHRAAEVSRRISAEPARWVPDAARQRRAAAKR